WRPTAGRSSSAARRSVTSCRRRTTWSARVLSALDRTAVPVPRTLYLGDADGPLGAPFYVMERVLGHICRNALPPGYADTPEQRAAIGGALVETLAELHTTDPAAIGLADFGRPEGFMERQLRRWSKQWESSKTD